MNFNFETGLHKKCFESSFFALGLMSKSLGVHGLKKDLDFMCIYSDLIEGQ